MKGVANIRDKARVFARAGLRDPRRLLGRLAVAMVVAWLLLGGNRGFLKLVSLQREKWALEGEIRELVRDNEALADRARELERQSAYYERRAREELMLARPGEIIYRFKDDNREQ